MTIELSLRRRAMLSKWFAAVLLGLAVIILATTYFSLPTIADETLSAVTSLEKDTHTGIPVTAGEAIPKQDSFLHLHVFALTTLVLAVVAITFSSYMLGKAAFVQWETADRLCSVADALSLSGNDFSHLEKAVALLVPKSRLESSSRVLSPDQLKELVEIVKKLR